MPTTVVHVNDPDGYDVYIGRAVPRRGLKHSIFANPFPIQGSRSRETALAKYREWLRRQPGLTRVARHTLKGKRLGCWCAPKPCHGDILAAVADGEEP